MQENAKKWKNKKVHLPKKFPYKSPSCIKKKKPPAPSAPVWKCIKNATSQPLAYPFLRRSCIKMQKSAKKNATFGQNRKCKKMQKMQVAFSPLPCYSFFFYLCAWLYSLPVNMMERSWCVVCAVCCVMLCVYSISWISFHRFGMWSRGFKIDWRGNCRPCYFF